MKKLILISILFYSCGVTHDLKKAQRLIERAKAKGARVTADTIYRDIKVEVPGGSSTVKPVLAIDTVALSKALNSFDSLQVINRGLIEAVNSGINKEQALSELAINNRKLKDQIARIGQGFAKDSVYHFEDSLLTVTVEARGGRIYSIQHTVKPRMVTVRERTAVVEKIECKDRFWPGFIVGCLALVILVAVVWRVTR